VKRNGEIIKLDAGNLISRNGKLRKADRNALTYYVVEFTTEMLMRAKNSVTPKEIAKMQFGFANEENEATVRYHGWRSYRAAQDKNVPIYPAYSDTRGGRIECYKIFKGDAYDMAKLPKYLERCKNKALDAATRWRLIQKLFLKPA
jgi:uncharacterized membrane protein